jgi:hypothetical protein
VLSLALLAGGPALLWAWSAGAVVGTGHLVAGVAMVAATLAGRWAGLLLLGRGGLPRPQDAPDLPAPSAVERLRRPDGTELHVERPAGHMGNWEHPARFAAAVAAFATRCLVPGAARRPAAAPPVAAAPAAGRRAD